jgi:hypothetical protein
VGVRAAEGVEPSSLDRPVKGAAAAPMAEGRAAEVEFPPCALLELAASASWTEDTWAEAVMAPRLALAGVQPWPVLGLAGTSRPSSWPWTPPERPSAYLAGSRAPAPARNVAVVEPSWSRPATAPSREHLAMAPARSAEAPPKTREGPAGTRAPPRARPPEAPPRTRERLAATAARPPRPAAGLRDHQP